MGDLLQKRVTFVQAAVACATTLLLAVSTSVAWGTSFQTKASAATESKRVEKVEKDQASAASEVKALHDDFHEMLDTMDRIDNKVDQILLRGHR